MTKCPICKSKISFESVQHDKNHGFRPAGEVRPGQQITTCISCSKLMHTGCVMEVGFTLEGRYVRRANETLRDRVDAYGDVKLPFCRKCGEETIWEIVKNFEGGGDLIGAARFLDHLGRFDEAQGMMERARSMVGREPDLDGLMDRLRAGDLVVPYECPYCGTTVEVTGTVNPEELDACQGCGAAMDSERLLELLAKTMSE